MRTLFIQQLGEEIREIEDFPGYWASNLGRIISDPKFGKGGHKEWVALSPGVGKTGRFHVARVRCTQERSMI
jgi:hypothetical protein